MRFLRLVLAISACLWGTATYAEDVGPVPLTGDEFLTGAFTLERHLEGFETPLTSNGWFFVGADGALIWATEHPIQSTLLVDDKGLRQIGPDGTVVANGPSPTGMTHFTQSLSGLISGDISPLQDSFALQTRDGSTAEWRIGLIPKSDDVAAHIEAVEIAGRDFVTQVMIRKAGADVDVIRLKDHERAAGTRPGHIRALLD